ncbi:MAG: tetratricopeptide repeat protein [Proteobacteria bacterium]|nr:tetratricopeptide repeat protein [Pseudomonadota bacterium]
MPPFAAIALLFSLSCSDSPPDPGFFEQALQHQRAGELDKAEDLLTRSIENTEAFHGREHVDVARDLTVLADIYEAQNRLDMAEAALVRATDLQKKTYGPNDPRMVLPKEKLGRFFLAQKRHSEANPLLVDALAARESDLDTDAAELVMLLIDVSLTQRGMGDLTSTMTTLDRAAATASQYLGDDHGLMASIQAHRGEAYRRLNKYKEAKEALNLAVAISEEKWGPNDPAVALALNNLAVILYESGDIVGAEQAFSRVEKIRSVKATPPKSDASQK